MTHPRNTGSGAGVNTGMYNLGTSTSPIFINAKATGDGLGGSQGDERGIVRHITQMSAVLDEQNVPDEGRYLLATPAICELLINSELGEAYLSGDSTSMKRNGLMGRFGNFEVIKSQLLAKATGVGATNIMAGTKMGLTFAQQLTNTETLRVSETFGTVMRGLQVYGYKVVKPEAIASSYVVPILNHAV